MNTPLICISTQKVSLTLLAKITPHMIDQIALGEVQNVHGISYSTLSAMKFNGFFE